MKPDECEKCARIKKFVGNITQADWDRAAIAIRMQYLCQNIAIAAGLCRAFNLGWSHGFWEAGCRLGDDDKNPAWEPGCGHPDEAP